MRLLLASALIFLFLWLRNAQTSSETMHGRPCESSSVSETVVSLLLSPLSVYSWLFSTLVRLLFSAPALLLSSLYYTLLFVMALPWCVSTLCLSLLLTCLRVAIFVFHLALVVGLVAILVLVRHKMAGNDVAENVAKERRKELKSCNSMAGLGNLFGRRIATHG